MWRAAAILLLAALIPASSTTAIAAAPPPRRIVSVNPCADALLRELARPEQIVAISRLSHDPRAASVPANWASRYPGVGIRAEELLDLDADLVLGGPFVPRETARMARRLGIPLHTLPAPATIAATRQQITDLARLLGNPQRGAALIARIDKAVAAARPPIGAAPVTALIRQQSGMVAGPNTLADDMLAHAGFVNHARHWQLQPWDLLSVEKLAASPPQLLLTPDGRPPHPALAGHVVTRRFPMRLLWCGGSTIIDAMAALASARQSL